jgi:hypothetical protein
MCAGNSTSPEPVQPSLSDFFPAAIIEGNNCIGFPGEAAFNAFVAQVNVSLAVPGALFSGIDPELQTPALFELAAFLQRGLCASAFGSIAPQVFANSPSGIGPTALNSGCPQDIKGADFFTSSFQPLFSAILSTPGNFVQLQWTRSFTFFRQSVASCDVLNSLREGFKATVSQLPLITYSALSLQELGQTVERLWSNSLGERARQAAGLTPGFEVNERTSFLTETAPGVLDLAARIFNNFYNINPDDLSMSSRLPFSRADFLSTGTQFYYVTTTAFDPAPPSALFSNPLQYVQVVGQSRLMAAGDSTRNPALQFFRATPFRQLPLGTYGPPAPYAVNVNSYPIGDDFISLLDACASGAALSIDVHNFRRVQDIGSPPGSFPFANMSFSESCNLGASISNETLDAAVLFSVPVQCPRWLTWLGQARANSSYAKVSSFKRRTYWEMRNSSQGFNAALQEMLEQSDFSDRADLLSTLFIRRDSANFTHSDLNHYKTCAPSTCTFTRVKARTLFEYGIEGVGVLGGTSYSVIAFLGCVVALACAAASHYSPHFFHPPLSTLVLAGCSTLPPCICTAAPPAPPRTPPLPPRRRAAPRRWSWCASAPPACLPGASAPQSRARAAPLSQAQVCVKLLFFIVFSELPALPSERGVAA